jgi:hypothetical protein
MSITPTHKEGRVIPIFARRVIKVSNHMPLLKAHITPKTIPRRLPIIAATNP